MVDARFDDLLHYFIGIRLGDLPESSCAKDGNGAHVTSSSKSSYFHFASD
jgi:hypothetical protein